MIGGMTLVKINAITVPDDSGDELARRFAAQAGAVDDQEGFEGFELLKPTDDRSVWLVVTRWRDEESFQAWVNSPAFMHGHRSAAERAGGEAPQRPVGVHSEVWSMRSRAAHRDAARRSTYCRSSGPNHGGEPAAAFSASRAGWAVATSETCTRGSLRPHLIRACAQVVTPNGRSGSRSAGLGYQAHSLSLAEGAHQQDPDTELVSQRQNGALYLAVGGVVGHLNRIDAAGAHEIGEVGEGRRRVVGGADQADQPPVPHGFQHRQVSAPGDQVVDLHQVDPAAIPVHRAVQLGHALVWRWGPDLVSDDNLVTPAL